jgi:hypothetical protein
MSQKASNLQHACQYRHRVVSERSQTGMGWLAALIALAGLLMALAAAQGWGEAPLRIPNGVQSPPNHVNGETDPAKANDAAPDASVSPEERLVG